MLTVSEEATPVRRMRERIDDLGQRFTNLSARIAATEQSLASANFCVAGADQRLNHARFLLSEFLEAAWQEGRADCFPRTSDHRPPAMRTGAPTPETKLLRAVLEEAIDSLRKNRARNNRRKRRLYGEDAQWIRDRDDQSPFSFQYICTILGLDPDSVSASLLARYGPVQ